MEVTKQDGTKEPFNIDKIRRSLWKAAVDAGYTEEYNVTIKQILIKVYRWSKEKKQMTTTEIRQFVLSESDKKIVEKWTRFDERYKIHTQFREMKGVQYDEKINDKGYDTVSG